LIDSVRYKILSEKPFIIENMTTHEILGNYSGQYTIVTPVNGVSRAIFYLNSPSNGKPFQLSYNMSGLNWAPEYQVILGANSLTMNMSASITNSTDATLNIATGALIYGAIQNSPQPRSEMMLMSSNSMDSSNGSFTSVNNYFSYPIKNLEVLENSTLLYPLVSMNLPYRVNYLFNSNSGSVVMQLNFNSSMQNFIPTTSMSVYDSSMTYLGHGQYAQSVASGASITLSRVTSIQAKNSLVSSLQSSGTSTVNNSNVVTLENNSGKSVNMTIEFNLYGNSAKIKSCTLPFSMKDSTTAVMNFTLKPEISKININWQYQNR